MIQFKDLIKPLIEEEFFSEYWQEKAIYLAGTGTAAHRFKELPQLEDFPQLLTGTLAAQRWTFPEVTAYASLVDQSDNVRGLGPVPLDLLPRLYNAGASISFTPVDRYSPALAEFVQSISTSARIPAKVVTTCYLTPARSGSAIHFDSQNVFLCQVSGSKHWRFSTARAATFPPVNVIPALTGYDAAVAGLRSCGVDVHPPEECEFTEATLRPGDVLYMPPGTWHVPRTSESPSMHYTLTFPTLSFGSVFVMLTKLWMLQSDDWRKDIRFMPRFGDDKELLRFLDERLEEARKHLKTANAEELLGAYRRCTDLAKSMQLQRMIQPLEI